MIQREGRSLYQEMSLVTGEVVVLRAEAIREERTGIHARLSLWLDGEMRDWSTINIEKSDQRIKICNSAHRKFPQDTQKTYTARALQADVGSFCAQLWPVWLGIYEPEAQAGDDKRTVIPQLVDGYVVEGGGTIAFAPPGRGKSHIFMALAIAADCGMNGLLPIKKQAKTLYINLERSRESIGRRIGNINEALGIDRSRPLRVLNARGRSLLDIIGSVERFVDREGIEFVILDSISRAGFGDLTADRPVNAIIDALNGACPTWLAIGHTPRSDATHVFGSQHFDAGADVMVQVSSAYGETENDLGLAMQATKGNDVRLGNRRMWGLGFADDQTGLERIWIADESEFPDLAAEKKVSKERLAREFLLSIGWADADEIAEACGMTRANTSHMMNAMKDVLKRRDGRRVMFGMGTKIGSV